MSGTARELTRRLRLLLALGAAATLTLFLAYRGVHDDTVPLSESSTPGILAVDTAQNALRAAHAVVSGPEGDLSGEFHTQISVAHQSLALAASENVIGTEGRHDLQTVTGLIAVYSGWVERWGEEDQEALGAAYLSYAEQVLGVRPASGAGPAAGDEGAIMSRLDALRGKQLAEAERQATFPWQLWVGWSAVTALYVALFLALLDTQRFLRRHFRRPVQVRLLAATVVCGLGVPVLGWITRDAQRAMAGSVAEIRVRAKDPDEIPLAAERVHSALADAGFWASLSDWVLLGGAAVMALTVWGLWPRIAEYRPRGPR
ncbi:hypothetical protein [Streptomyces sp. NPDC088789]|uniref:hypothetical protein n=1 Tax=Streptomyces sp. NPDC088789 TaxID=3365899 RepID=UPI003819C7E2